MYLKEAICQCGLQYPVGQLLCTCGLFVGNILPNFNKYVITLPAHVIFERLSEMGPYAGPKRKRKWRWKNGKTIFEINGQAAYVKYHKELEIFQRNPQCQRCHRLGTQFLVFSRFPSQQHRDSSHLNLQFVTGDFYLMTIDHIVPKAHGGSNDSNNLQTMCWRCNCDKGDSLG